MLRRVCKIPLPVAGNMVNSSFFVFTSCLSLICVGEGDHRTWVLQDTRGVCAAHSLLSDPPNTCLIVYLYTHPQYGDKILGIRVEICLQREKVVSRKLKPVSLCLGFHGQFTLILTLSTDVGLMLFRTLPLLSGCFTQAPQPVPSEHDPRLKPHSQRQGGPPQGNESAVSLG